MPFARRAAEFVQLVESEIAQLGVSSGFLEALEAAAVSVRAAEEEVGPRFPLGPRRSCLFGYVIRGSSDVECSDSKESSRGWVTVETLAIEQRRFRIFVFQSVRATWPERKRLKCQRFRGKNRGGTHPVGE